MIMHLKDLGTSPPGDWKFTQKESGFSMRAVTFGSLLNKISQHRANMSYPHVSDGYATLAEELEDQICQAMSPSDQVANCEMGLHTPTSVDWKKVGKFLKTMVDWATGHGLKPVSQEEAERRAAICVKCPLNVGMSGCGVCRQGLQAIRVGILNKQTSHDAGLRACGVCGCDNKLQVHVPISVLKTNGDYKYPEDWCWKATNGVNESTI